MLNGHVYFKALRYILYKPGVQGFFYNLKSSRMSTVDPRTEMVILV